jgi:hypothetical protein
MLSAGEVLAPGDRTVRVALWPGTHTAENLARREMVLFCYVAPGAVLYVRARPRPLENADGVKLHCFELVVESVESDIHEGMPVTTGIGFTAETMAPETIVASWLRQLDTLRHARVVCS